MQRSYVLGAVGKLLRYLGGPAITAEWLEKSKVSFKVWE